MANTNCSQTVCFDDLLILSKSTYQEHLGSYMITKSDFVIGVVESWQDFRSDILNRIEKSFCEYDQFHQRDALNSEQFHRLIHQELNLVSSVKTQNRQLFEECVRNLEQNEHVKQESLIGLDALKSYLLEANHDIYPFYRHMCKKY